MAFLERLREALRPEEAMTGFIPNPEQDNDPRNLRYEDIAPLGASVIPTEGDIERQHWSLNQDHTSSCTCHSTVHGINQVTECQLSPRYAFAKIKNNPEYDSSRLEWGAYEVDSLKLQCNEGICEYKYAENLSTNSDEAYRALTISPAMEASARRHKGGSYIYVTDGSKDQLERYDDIVRYMYEQKRPVKVGIPWYKVYNNARKGGVVPAVPPTGTVSGHSMLAVAWKRINGHEYLGFRNSWGETWGDKGRIWLPKGFFKISSAIAYLPPKKTEELEIVIPSPLEVPKNKHKERANAQELQAMIGVKFPLNVEENARRLNIAAVSYYGTTKLVFIQAVSYLGWTFTDVINHLYARSRGKVSDKAYSLDFSKQKPK